MANTLVVKRNEIIEGKYSLSAAAQKVAAAIIAQVNPEAEELPKIVFTAKEAMELLGMSKQYFYREMDKITDELGQILIRHKKLDTNELTKSNFFLRSRLEGDKSVTFEFHPDIEPYIRDFRKNFTQYQLAQIKNLTSRYSIRLYEILRRYHPIRCERVTSYYELSIKELRETLGIAPNKHTRTNNLRQHVLNKAQKEIAEKTDLKFTFDLLRNGRKIDRIKFNISHNAHFEQVENEHVLEPEILPDGYDEAVAAMLASAVPELPKDIVNLLASRLDAVAASQAFLSYTKAKQVGKVKDPAAYFLGILKHQEQQAKNSHNPDMDDMSWVERGFNGL
ncbi:replication initiation protein [Zooshikella ganghwensis]|uniref:replication initiation protein n=1 Tax=Zooshikella ganghwensis TaxID=202772 RepID=UPI00040FFC6F|nr:replication initiation protein [Zooshikella ganghwensis]